MENEYNFDKAREYIEGNPNVARMLTRRAREFPFEKRQEVYQATVEINRPEKGDMIAMHDYMLYILSLNDDQLDGLISLIPDSK